MHASRPRTQALSISRWLRPWLNCWNELCVYFGLSAMFQQFIRVYLLFQSESLYAHMDDHCALRILHRPPSAHRTVSESERKGDDCRWSTFGFPCFDSLITKCENEWWKINSNRVVNWIELYLSFPNDALFGANWPIDGIVFSSSFCSTI